MDIYLFIYLFIGIVKFVADLQLDYSPVDGIFIGNFILNTVP